MQNRADAMSGAVKLGIGLSPEQKWPMPVLYNSSEPQDSISALAHPCEGVPSGARRLMNTSETCKDVELDQKMSSGPQQSACQH